jgi:hypothetical protein
MAGSEVRREHDRPEADRVAVLEPVIDVRGWVADDPDPEERPQREHAVWVIAAGREGVGARLAGPQLRARRLLEHRQAAGVIGVRFRVQEHFDILDIEPSFAMLAMINFAVVGWPASSKKWPSGPVMRKAEISLAPT